MTKTTEVSRDLRELLYALAMRFKSHGVTSMFTLESSSLFSTDAISERGYSPIADNIVMLRYQLTAGELRPTLTVVKTRGSAHDFGTYAYSIARGGIRIGERVGKADAPRGVGGGLDREKRRRRP
jgi:circadian clock protein KaiC